MTEDEAQAWIERVHGGAGRSAMERLVLLVAAAAVQQNLIAPSTFDSIWSRHVVDSAQLLRFADQATETTMWLDIGSGAGFPGLVIAALSEQKVTLVEPRKRRADFLLESVQALDLGHRVEVKCARVEAVTLRADIVSARAVGSLDAMFAWASSCYSTKTRWILPKGQKAREEVASAQQAWHGTFHVEHSITDPASLIVLASGVKRR